VKILLQAVSLEWLSWKSLRDHWLTGVNLESDCYSCVFAVVICTMVKLVIDANRTPYILIITNVVFWILTWITVLVYANEQKWLLCTWWNNVQRMSIRLLDDSETWYRQQLYQKRWAAEKFYEYLMIMKVTVIIVIMISKC